MAQPAEAGTPAAGTHRGSGAHRRASVFRNNVVVEQLPAGLTVLDLDGQARELRSLASDRPVVVAFLRHFG